MYVIFCFKQKTAYEMRISDWSSDVCSSDLTHRTADGRTQGPHRAAHHASPVTAQAGRSRHHHRQGQHRRGRAARQSPSADQSAGRLISMTDTYLADFATRLNPRQASNILFSAIIARSDKHTSDLQPHMRTSYA